MVTALAVTGGAVPARQTAANPVPVEQEPQHHPVFKNDVLAVLDVRLPPGYVSLFHTHSNDNVSVRIETALTRTDTPTETGTPQTAVVGRVVFNSAHPPYTHRIANLGVTTIRIVDIEVLAAGPTRVVSTFDELAGHDIALENDRVRLSRITLDPGTTVPGHSHPRGWLEVTVRGPEPGSFRWRKAGEIAPALTGGAAGAEYVEIAVK
jgi:quercetin dioxygenase-like cupin family protein